MKEEEEEQKEEEEEEDKKKKNKKKKKKKTAIKCNKLLLSTKIIDFTSNISPTRTVSCMGYMKSTNKALLSTSYEAQVKPTE
jgi:hypothetical protein